MLSRIHSQVVASTAMEEFERRKAAALASMASTEPDRSPKGSLDAPIIPLLTSLNLHPSFFTTSSCSGRISILSQPLTTTSTTTIKKKAKGGSWLYITHDPADPDLVTDLLFTKAHHSSTHDAELTFRFEPFIVAVECRDLASAQSLVSTAISCGFRESGITSAHKRVIVAIRCSIRLEVPLGTVKAVRVSPEYVGYLVRIANEKMESNRSRTERFLRVFLETQFTSSEILSCKQVMNEKNNEVVVVGGEDQGDCFDGSSNEVSVDLIQFGAGECGSEEANSNTHLGLEDHQCTISVVKMVVVGEPVEKIFLWGHSVSILDDKLHSKLVIFGGFGGIGRHSRRNDTLVLDTQCGLLEAINVEGSPSPRLGHTSSVIGECVFIIGGRGDPLTILNDVWAFNVAKNKWRLVECNGSLFPPRQRHAAAVVGSKIFVFGGLNNEKIFSSMHILDTEDSQWSEVLVQGEWPCARHSHALVSKGSQLFMFGGYDGEKALDELYTFDVNKHLWKKEKTIGRPPCARFSHSMFVYKNHLGIIGGCPVTKHYHELALLDLQTSVWKHMMLDSAGEDLFVRSIANVVGDDLLMIGGGAACYAFGTKFSEPMKMNLLPLASTDGSSMLEKHSIQQAEVGRYQKDTNILGPSNSAKTMTGNSKLNHGAEMLGENLESDFGSKFWVLQLERKNVKMGKDILKKFGWLDLGRKVYSYEDEICFSLPVTGKFYAIFQKHELDRKFAFDGGDGPPQLPVTAEKLSIDNISCQTALNYLFSLGGSLVRDEVAHVRKTLRSPQKIMTEAISSLIKGRGLPMQLLEQIPTRWERLGDIVVLPVTSFKDPIWDSIGMELWPTVAKALGTRRLARQGRIAPTGTRDSTLEILVGDNGWVHHRENGITYSFDTTKCMFSWGNYSEKVRMARLDCRDEVIVDLFAGIGYFVLPFLVGAKAKLVYACEWNPHAVDALRHNVQANSVAEQCIILEGDNRVMAPEGVADRVCLGLLPSSKDSWVTAVRALRVEGGMLHVHENVKDSEEPMWSEHVAKSIHDIAISEGLSWEVWVEHVERVKWYAPHIRHLVVDVRCKQLGS